MSARRVGTRPHLPPDPVVPWRETAPLHASAAVAAATTSLPVPGDCKRVDFGHAYAPRGGPVDCVALGNRSRAGAPESGREALAYACTWAWRGSVVVPSPAHITEPVLRAHRPRPIPPDAAVGGLRLRDLPGAAAARLPPGRVQLPLSLAWRRGPASSYGATLDPLSPSAALLLRGTRSSAAG